MNFLGQCDFSSQPKLLDPLGLDEANEKNVAEDNSYRTSRRIQREPARQGLGIDYRWHFGERFQRQDPEQSREEENLDDDNQRHIFEVSDEAKSPTNPNCAGESNQGLLVYFDCARGKKDAKFKAFAQALIAEENEDRLTILNRTIATNENFSESDLPKVQKIFASLNRDNAKKGEKIQLEVNSWSFKKYICGHRPQEI